LGNCGLWPWVWPYNCWGWGQSTLPAEVSSVTSEQSAQTAKPVAKGDGNIVATRTK
jgi:hypothetical protein